MEDKHFATAITILVILLVAAVEFAACKDGHDDGLEQACTDRGGVLVKKTCVKLEVLK